MTDKIDFEELKRRLADPNIDEKSLAKYFGSELRLDNGLAPTLMPNPETVEGTMGPNQESLDSVRVRGKLGLGILNSIYKNRRRRRFEDDIKKKVGKPILLAEGDSWFEYPIWLKDTIDYLLEDHTIYCVSGAGDELDDMVNASDPEYVDALDRIIRRENLPLRGILLSGGGNDIVGETFYDFLKDFDPTKSANDQIDHEAFNKKFDEITESYEMIIDDIQDSWGKSIPIFIHGYDHANPLPSQGIKIPPLDGWLGDWLRKRRIHDVAIQKEIVKILIDRFYEVLTKLAERDGVWLVDNRGLVGSDWNDELHPNDNGFERVAENFKRVMREAGVYEDRSGG